MSDLKFAEYLASNIAAVPGREAYKKSYVECCVRVMSKVLNYEKSGNILAEFDAVLFDHSPWNNNYSLLAVVTRCQNEGETISLVLKQCFDAVMVGHIGPEDFAVTKLKQKNTSVIETLMLVCEMRGYLLSTFIDELSEIKAEHKEFCKSKFSSPPLFRKLYSPFTQKRDAVKGTWVPVNQDHDLTMFNGWGEQAVAFVDLLDQFVYLDRFYPIYRRAQRSSKTIHEMLEYPSVAERLKSCGTP